MAILVGVIIVILTVIGTLAESVEAGALVVGVALLIVVPVCIVVYLIKMSNE